MERLDRKVIIKWTVADVVSAVAVGGVALAADLLGLARVAWWPVAPGVTGVGVVLLLAVSAAVYPRLACATWGFSLRPHDLLLRSGVAWTVDRSVPRARIQHVDVRRGPLDRVLGLATVVVFTSAGNDAEAEVPGLAVARAEALRDALVGPLANAG